MPVAVATAGLLLLAVRGYREWIPLGLVTVTVAGLYLVASWLLRREYVRALMTRIREGRVKLNDLPPGAVRLSPAEVRTLGEELDHADAPMRAFLVDALGRFGGRQALETLRRYLADPAPSVRVAALGAVATLGDAQALPWVIPLLADPSPPVRAAAVRAAVALGGPTAGPTIGLSLDDPDGA